MICYRDMTFCAAQCATKECPRQLNERQREGARKWWSHDPNNAPIAVADFHHNCPDYAPESRI